MHGAVKHGLGNAGLRLDAVHRAKGEQGCY